MSEFEKFCENKPVSEREALAPVYVFLEDRVGAVVSRAHFYLIFGYGPLPVVKMHTDKSGRVVLTFVNGSELRDEKDLLRGKGMVKTILIKSLPWWEAHKEEIGRLVKRSEVLVLSRWDSISQGKSLRPDQESP